jgi:glycerophosphoryl diester phosphodiesterase
LFNVVESFVAGKYGDPARCEDAVVLTPHHVAVIDGATTEAGHEIDGRAPGRFAMEVMREAIGHLDPDADAMSAISELTSALADALAAHGLRPGELASACVLIASEHRHEIWRVGNSTFVIGGEPHPQYWQLAEVPARLRATYLRALLDAGSVTAEELRQRDPSLELIAPLLRVEHVFRNAPDAGELTYTAIDGLEVPSALIERVTLPADVDVVFASDGYPVASGRLAQAETYLRDSLAEDPLRIYRHPEVRGVMHGMTSYDDRAYLRFQLK